MIGKPMTQRILRLTVSIAAIVFISTGCTKKNQDDQIKIGVFGPFTGGSAPMGLSMRNGVQIAVEQLNASNGALGKKPIQGSAP